MQNVENLQLRVETLVVRENGKVGRLRPDEDGYFTNVPIAVLGQTTRNNTYYDVPSFTDQLTNKDSKLNMRLTSGQLYGEYGHPNMLGLKPDEQMMRMVDIREQMYSHHIRSIYTGSKLEGGGILLCADVKPTGPYGQPLLDNFEDPCMNTAFSLRALTSNTVRGNVSYRFMRKLVTFDAVGAGGYAQAAKAYALGLESFDSFSLEITPDMEPQAVFTQHSLENFTDTELNDLFRTNSIFRQKTVVTKVAIDPAQRSRPGFGRFLTNLYHDTIKE